MIKFSPMRAGRKNAFLAKISMCTVLGECTVEPPNKGHFGNGPFVLCSEVVLISDVCHILTVNNL